MKDRELCNIDSIWHHHQSWPIPAGTREATDPLSHGHHAATGPQPVIRALIKPFTSFDSDNHQSLFGIASSRRRCLSAQCTDSTFKDARQLSVPMDLRTDALSLSAQRSATLGALPPDCLRLVLRYGRVATGPVHASNHPALPAGMP